MKKQDLSVLKTILLREMEGGMCNECGGQMYEGMCTECGYMEEISYADSGLENAKLADLNKDGDISRYEKARGAAIEKNMEEGHEGADHEVSMALNSIESIMWAANELKKNLQGGERDIPAWIQDHITNAENYILQAAKNYHEYGEKEPEQDMSLASMAPSEINEMVKKVGSKYNVYSKKGKKLGSHPSKKKAQKQMAAIEISKQGK